MSDHDRYYFRRRGILNTIHALTAHLLADPTRLGHRQHEDELHHIESHGANVITVAIRPTHAARNGMVIQDISVGSAERLAAKLEAAIAEAKAQTS